MINLLPLSEKQKFFWEKQMKTVLILGFILTSFVICLYLMLFSVKNFISGQQQAELIFLEDSKKNLESDSIKKTEERLIYSNSIFEQLTLFYDKQIDLTKTIRDVSGYVPDQSNLIQFNFRILSISENKDYFANISVSGFSPSRQELLEFKNNLENSGFNINFRDSDWLKPENIDFKIDIKI